MMDRACSMSMRDKKCIQGFGHGRGNFENLHLHVKITYIKMDNKEWLWIVNSFGS